MKIITIFAGEDKHKGVLSVDFDSSDESTDDSGTELIKLTENWFDTEYLHKFFTEHEKDLNSNYYGRHISISEAIKSVREEAYELFEKLSTLAQNQNPDNGETLSSIFQPLIDGDNSASELQQNKYKIKSNLKCLRLYAIMISNETFIVTGGAIKLVERMHEREHLRNELNKLDTVRTFLKEEGIIDQDDFNSYEL